MMLVRVLPVGTEPDKVAETDDRHWQATPHAKFERLLRETNIPIGLLVQDTCIRLLFALRGETSGFATFSVPEMAQIAGRPIFAAMSMLLGEERLFSLGEKQRLPAILSDSRKYQNVVSTKLAEQVLAALFELVRGLQAADDQARGDLLRDVLAADPNHVYKGLLTVLMRLVFILYAEDRGLLSNDPVYVNHYAVTGLFDRLRADAGRFPDTMDQRVRRLGAAPDPLPPDLRRRQPRRSPHPRPPRLPLRPRPLQRVGRPPVADRRVHTPRTKSASPASPTASSSAS